MNAHLSAFIDLRFANGGKESSPRILGCDTPPHPRWQRRAPIPLLSGKLHSSFETWIAVEVLQPERDRIDLLPERNVVDETFDREDIVVRSNAPPETRRNSRRFGADIFHLEIWEAVRLIDRRIHGIDINAILERWRKPARDHGGPSNAMRPADDLAVLDRSRNRVVIDGPINVVLGVFFALPRHFERSIDVHSNASGADRHVLIKPATEATTNVEVVDGHFLDRQSDGLGDILLHTSNNLSSDPDFAGVLCVVNRAVQRLHCRVRKEWQFINAFVARSFRERRLDVTHFLRDRARPFAGLP